MNESLEVDIDMFEAEESDESPSKQEDATASANTQVSPPDKHRMFRLPLARVKSMMKMDPDCAIVSQDAVLLVTKATEMFLEFMGKESYKQIINLKRKTVMKRDVESVIENIPHLCFLDGTLE